MWLALQHNRADDFVIATGVSYSVRSFAENAFAELGMKIIWSGEGLDETGIDKKTGRTVIRIDPAFFRPAEVDLLVGDASKAKAELGWAPKTTLDDLIREMVRADLEREGPYAEPIEYKQAV